MIELVNLKKSYGHKEVLKGIDMQFEAAKIYGIVGENGAGKTTLFNCIAGILDYTGQIKSSLIPLKDHLGFLETQSFFFSKMTGKEYIQLLINARNIKSSIHTDQNIFELPLNDYVETYSSGMKKKLALTAVLLQENQYFIFDEPFNGVDIQSNMIITEIFKTLKSLNKTILLSSHIFSTLRSCCDSIHRLKDGIIENSVDPSEFDLLEREMKDFTIGDKIKSLNLK